MTDKEIRPRLVDMETAKIHRCAERLMTKGLFTSEELSQTLKEYGVARAYFEQLYHIDWCYEWIKEGEMTFEEFIRDFIFKANGDIIFRDSIDSDEYVNRYRLNGNKVEHYEQQYRYRIAFKKKDRLTLPL